MHDLQNYEQLPIGKDREVLALRDLPSAFGLEGASTANLIILDKIKVKARFLGLGLGAQVIRRVFLRYGSGGGIGVIAPFPLQFGGRSDVGSDEHDFDKAEQSLRRFYRKIGFKNHPVAKALMVCDLDNKLLRKIPVRSRGY